jgi:hypothetical protein
MAAIPDRSHVKKDMEHHGSRATTDEYQLNGRQIVSKHEYRSDVNPAVPSHNKVKDKMASNPQAFDNKNMDNMDVNHAAHHSGERDKMVSNPPAFEDGNTYNVDVNHDVLVKKEEDNMNASRLEDPVQNQGINESSGRGPRQESS